MKSVKVIFPHQLFENNPLLEKPGKTYLVEESLFFTFYGFHKQKIAFHRATMKAYQQFLQTAKVELVYIDSKDNLSDVRQLINQLGNEGIDIIYTIDPVDDWLKKRMIRISKDHNIKLEFIPSPNFINRGKELEGFFSPEKKKYFQTQFYISQRKKLNILINEDLKPVGGQWSFDADNRKKYPRKKIPPQVSFPREGKYHKEAIAYVNENFENNPGLINPDFVYPIDFKSSKAWLEQFLAIRFAEFGTYEDAIVSSEHILNHSLLTPMLNIGLITPRFVVKRIMEFADKNKIAINSVEGFIRQVIGWREFIRGVYECQGVKQRTTNFWKFTRKIPKSFYDGSTGILPLDMTIKKVLATGYCHHIERLMILGNFMVLCEFDPDEVYKWFMELFIDAYDWVMVPNVYGMSQFADGGLMSTKPYISGSNYIKKMSNYPKGDWEVVWDGLFWHFMWKQRWFFEKNPRLSMLVRNLDKMDVEKKNRHINNAKYFLDKL